VTYLYERLVDNTSCYLRTIIWMMGIEHDDELLESMLVQSQTAPFKDFQRYPTLIDKNEKPESRLARASPSRSGATRKLLCQLTWEPLKLTRRPPYYDSVEAGSDGVPYSISSGARRNGGAAWLASRVPERLRAAMRIEDLALAAMPVKGEFR